MEHKEVNAKLPENFEDCFPILDSMLSDEDKQIILKSEELDFMIQNFDICLWIRNKWIFNKDCKLNSCFNWSTHDDEKSIIILVKYKKHLENKL